MLPKAVVESPIVKAGQRMGFTLYNGVITIGLATMHKGDKRFFISNVSGLLADPQTGKDLDMSVDEMLTAVES